MSCSIDWNWIEFHSSKISGKWLSDNWHTQRQPQRKINCFAVIHPLAVDKSLKSGGHSPKQLGGHSRSLRMHVRRLIWICNRFHYPWARMQHTSFTCSNLFSLRCWFSVHFQSRDIIVRFYRRRRRPLDPLCGICAGPRHSKHIHQINGFAFENQIHHSVSVLDVRTFVCVFTFWLPVFGVYLLVVSCGHFRVAFSMGF